jgi:hypothetical protein
MNTPPVLDPVVFADTFRPGDLVRVKEGAIEQGKMGIVIRSPSVEGWQYIDLLLDGVNGTFNGYWLEHVDPVRADPIGV